ncbi:DUF1810 domain-containing protein [Rhizobium sp. CFBP 8762]|uniref:DUF1810 domain-containing protein n=1 Tax=Rhizobium sp. CFBP 8762 TaxID=2775279 RepID=UPI00177E38CA|nr:DUF1810 domain-containing protein [Rhizobium sp. CFBP 8762]MBD8554155.1 DUF1810 domain-containing protein [Rhizobium sp. CFBP 8762]
MTDTFNLNRFVDAQSGVYQTVTAELRAGAKRSHWMWFIFPQIDGLGFSPMAVRYAIRSLKEAVAYRQHPILGHRLTECTQAMLAHTERSAHAILGSPDDMKFRSSMTLFAATQSAPSIFQEAINQFYAGKPDEKSLALLKV